MLNPARNDGLQASLSKSRGIALLVMLAIILVAFTTIAISRLSHKSAEQKSRAKTTQSLLLAREAIMAFALMPVNPGDPPGILPCPDSNGDGNADALVGGLCPNRRGLVPYRTLGIEQPLDGAGAPIWYVVAAEYSGALVTPHNSTRASTLRLDVTQAMAFILFAPDASLAGQTRTSTLPLANAVAQFLEGENANSSLDNNYTDLKSTTQNDLVLAMSVRDFWTHVEGRVLQEVVALLKDYRNRCNVYPWPALYTPFGSNVSDPAPLATRTYEGRVPFTTASPSNWGAVCPPGTAPAAPAGWLKQHWGDLIYYAICKQPIPVNPPVAPNASCLQLGGGSGAEAIVIAPGRPVVTVPVAISDYFEGENATTLDNIFIQVKPVGHTDTFNDLIYVIR